MRQDVLGGDLLDGRVQRGARNRTKILDALEDLVEGGQLQPRAADIAWRSGVSQRTVFQHFRDMEALYAAASERVAARTFRELGPIDTSLPLFRRINEIVERRTRVNEATRSFVVSASIREAESERLLEIRRSLVAQMRLYYRQAFAPELRVMSRGQASDVVEMLVLMSSTRGWDRLRADQNLDGRRARSAIRTAIQQLLLTDR